MDSRPRLRYHVYATFSFLSDLLTCLSGLDRPLPHVPVTFVRPLVVLIVQPLVLVDLKPLVSGVARGVNEDCSRLASPLADAAISACGE